ncbi:DNA alkylation repair protein [Abyssisolibacter fermentans]|uniref:DNA alkylation repair protein n=1 Tax=Abyssisolibacter fermentans TaxID=1766203 RepID=UPI00082BBCDD|nr:DNA alkylation repair protein [Abyssisolibacter fermentans]
MYEDIINAFYDNRNKENAIKMSAYLKNNFPFLGIKKPERAALQKNFIKQCKQTKKIDWNFIYELWNLPEREFQYLALDLLIALIKELKKTDINKIENLIINKSWWDTVDLLASKLTGSIVSKYPELKETHIINWSNQENIWLIRTAILFQLKYKEKTDTEFLSKIITTNYNTNEFFINKAIGWILREYSKTNKQWVKSFIENNELSPLSIREGSKYI